MNDPRPTESKFASLTGAAPAPNPALRKLIVALSGLGKAIVVLRGASASANVCGTVRLGRDGADENALVLRECGCHVHVAWHEVQDFALEANNVGYGSEPTIVLRGRHGEPIIRFHFQPDQWNEVRAAIAPVLMGERTPAASLVRLAPIFLTASARNSDADDTLFALLEQSGIELVRLDAGDSSGADFATLQNRCERFEKAWLDADVTHLWAALGGYGCTELLPCLKARLGPPRGAKTFIGSSDVSLLGVWLALRFDRITYLHAPNYQDELLFSSRRQDLAMLLELVRGIDVPTRTYRLGIYQGVPADGSHIEGLVLPINLSAARSLSVMRDFHLPPRSLLFIEDVHEDRLRVARIIDDLGAAGFFQNVIAIVLGDFLQFRAGEPIALDPHDLAQLIHDRTALPVLHLGEFGHGTRRLPLVMYSPVVLDFSERHCDLTLGFRPAPRV